MTVTLIKLRGRVRSRLRDSDGRMANPSIVEIDQALADAYLALQSYLPAPTLYTASALTISAGSDLFSLPVSVSGSGYGTGTVEYAGQVELQLASNGQFLRRQTVEQVNAFRNGQNALVTGIPHIFALYQDNAQVVRGRCYPGAKVAEVVNMFASLKADDLRDYVGAGSSAMDDVTLNLGRDGAASLVAQTAAMLLARMDETAIKERGINPRVADAWFAEAADLAYAEAATRHSLESTGEVQDWVR